MYALDFEYDGVTLSSKDFIICNFDGQTGTSIGMSGHNITFDKVARDKGRKYGLTGTQYMECLTTTFDICKNPELYDYCDMEITNTEYRDIAKWLNRNEFLPFRPLYDINDLTHNNQLVLNASFNVSKIYVNSILYGIRLVMETDSPFAHGYSVLRRWDLLTSDGSISLDDNSDEIGYHYLDSFSVKCSTAGNLTISNAFTGMVTTVANCSANEKIVFYGDTQIITTDNSSHKIYNDFNYVFPMIGNSYTDKTNVITFSLPCTVNIQYKPLIKDIPD